MTEEERSFKSIRAELKFIKLQLKIIGETTEYLEGKVNELWSTR